jgi:hypothetical protein
MAKTGWVSTITGFVKSKWSSFSTLVLQDGDTLKSRFALENLNINAPGRRVFAINERLAVITILELGDPSLTSAFSFSQYNLNPGPR